MSAATFISDMAEQVSMPQVYIDIRRLIKNPDTRIEDYVNVIETDSMLSIRIIRIAKSEFFGYGRKVETLEQAIHLIGIIQLHDVLLCSLCIRTFSSIPAQIFNLKAFWLYSTQCGVAASIIAQYSRSTLSNHYFVLGLLHEVGHAAMYSKEAELSLRALEESQQGTRSLDELEREYLGFDYKEISCLLMKLWDLPEDFLQVASFHLHPEQAIKNCQYEVQIIHLAHTICQNPVIGKHQEIILKVGENVPQLNNLPANLDEIIIQKINQHTETVLSMLWPVSSQQYDSAKETCEHE